LVALVSAFRVDVDTRQAAGSVSSHFLGFTNDWWVINDPHYGEKWGKSGILTFDLQSPLVHELVASLTPALWRIGGTPADTVVYDIGGPPECPRKNQGPYPEPMCLNMERWHEINEFAQKLGLKISFGLNALYHRGGPTTKMNFTNVFNFLQYTAAKGYPIYAFQFGNELGNGVPRVAAPQLASDTCVIRGYINHLWPNPATRPLLVGPDSNPSTSYTPSFIKNSYKCIDATTYHAYATSAKDADIIRHLMDPKFLALRNNESVEYRNYVNSVLPPNYELPIWGGEIGPAYGGGAPGVTNRFLDSFWYLDHLGFLARHSVQTFARSTLSGGDYELLNRTTLLPNPDYWVAKIWATTVKGGRHSLHTLGSDPHGHIRHYAMCTNSRQMVVILLNFGPVHEQVSILHTLPNKDFEKTHTEYHVRAAGRDLQSPHAEYLASNYAWKRLELFHNRMPRLEPVVRPIHSAITVEGHTYVFVVLKTTVDIPACTSKF